MEPISPELALVDPELAARARALLPDPADERDHEPWPVAAATRSRRPRVRRDLLVRTAAWLALPSIALNIAYIRADARIDSAPTVAAPSAPTGTRPTRPPERSTAPAQKTPPRAKPKPTRAVLGASVHKARRHAASAKLRWPAVANAAAFDVILWRGHRRVADVWATERELALDDLACRTNMALPAGRYLWFVYPVLDTKARRYGPLLKWGKVEVPKRTRCRRHSSSATTQS
jgi:hypothetical protein